MSPIELRDISARVLPDLRQEDIATLVGMSERSMRRWLKGDASISGAATALLRLLRAKRITLEDVRAALSQPPNLEKSP